MRWPTLLFLIGCSSTSTPTPTPTPTTTPPTTPSVSPAAASVAASAPASSSSTSAPVVASAAAPVVEEPTFEQITKILFLDDRPPAACPSSLASEARIRCLYDERYKGDTKGAGLAHELYTRWKIVAGVEPAHTMDGGYRGMIKLEPAVPLNAERKHLEWIVASMHDFDQFFVELNKRAGSGKTAAYRFKPLTLRFVRSVAARTPSAYAHDWTVVWNLAGSLHTSQDAVRETLFHEIFHLNDFAHAKPGTDTWSPPLMSPMFDEIVRKCGVAIPCLGPFTPNETIVRNGTYYSFQPGNGVREYAAELALRYYREQRNVLRNLPSPATKTSKPFKCGPEQNAKSWALMRDEFFAGIDAVPACTN